MSLPVRTRCLVFPFLLVVLATCRKSNPRAWPIPKGGPIMKPAGSAAPNTAMGSNTQLARREVTAKVQPATLYARDGGLCKVSVERFKSVTVGDRVSCNWEDSKTP
jgi:hypothetical protein